MRWALVNTETNIVEYVIIWDGVGNLYENRPWLPVQLNENEMNTSSGWFYDPNNNPRFSEFLIIEQQEKQI
jgi:hypothetical protein